MAQLSLGCCVLLWKSMLRTYRSGFSKWCVGVYTRSGAKYFSLILINEPKLLPLIKWLCLLVPMWGHFLWFFVSRNSSCSWPNGPYKSFAGGLSVILVMGLFSDFLLHFWYYLRLYVTLIFCWIIYNYAMMPKKPLTKGNLLVYCDLGLLHCAKLYHY